MTKTDKKLITLLIWIGIGLPWGMMNGFILAPFVVPYLLCGLAGGAVVYWILFTFTREKKTGKVRFKYAVDLGRKKNKSKIYILTYLYIVMPLIIFFLGGFIFYTQLKVLGQVTSWVENKEKTEIVEYRVGDSKRTRG